MCLLFLFLQLYFTIEIIFYAFYYTANDKMSSRKRNRLSRNEIEALLDGDDSSDDALDLESSSSESSSSSDNEDQSYLLSDSDDDAALPSDWVASGSARTPFTFRGDPGVKFTVENKENPVEYFEQFFDEEIIDYLVNETNRFAGQFLQKNEDTLPAQSRARKWHDTSANEMKVFIGLLVLQGIDSKVDNSMYFSSRESVTSHFFRKVMSGRRFDLLQKFLHLVDNSTITS